MNNSNFICFNGDLVSAEKPLFNIQNRAFRYGDGLFESMRAIGTSVPFIKNHFKRLTEGCVFHGLVLPESFTEGFLAKEIKRLINANKQFQGARIRIGVYRKDGGNFTPVTNKTDYYIESISLDSNQFLLNTKGLTIDIYTHHKKPITSFNTFKGIPSQFYIKAALWAQENNLNDCILLNDNHNLVEATSSNLFLISNNTMSTPAISQGCLPGVMREIITELAKNQGYEISSEAIVKEKDLLNADEVLLTNAVEGIKWVVAYQNRRYFSKTTKKLQQALSDYALSLV